MTQPTIQAGSIATYSGQFASTSPFGRVVNTTVGAGTNRTLFVCLTFNVSSGTNVPASLTVTFGGSAGVGGTALSLYGTYDVIGAAQSCVVYKLDDPVVGAGEVFVGVGSWYGEKAAISVFVVDGLNGATRYSAITSNRDTVVATPKSISIAASADDITIYLASALKSDMLAAAGQIPFAATAQVHTTGIYANHSYKLGASSSVGMSWASGGTVQATDTAFVLYGTTNALTWTGTIGSQTGTVGSAIAPLSTSGYVSGGTAPYAYSAANLPPGLSIDSSTGSITGTPTTTGNYSTTVSATDSAGSPATVSSNAFAWTINATATATITTDAALFVGSAGTVAATIATAPFKNNAGSVLAGLSGLTVAVMRMADFTLAGVFTDQSTDGSGILTVTSTNITVGVEYAVVTRNAAGALGAEKYTATS